MIRLFVGMIIGAMSAIIAAGGPAIADRIMLNATNLMTQATGGHDYLLMFLGVWGMVAVFLGFWKRRQLPERTSKYSFLLR